MHGDLVFESQVMEAVIDNENSEKGIKEWQLRYNEVQGMEEWNYDMYVAFMRKNNLRYILVKKGNASLYKVPIFEMVEDCSKYALIKLNV